jgi:hypothetical protein
MSQIVERMLPLYEAKMMHLFDHRWATYESDGSIRGVSVGDKADPRVHAMPRYWLREEVVADRLSGKWDKEWLLAWRDICRSTDERTMISSVLGSGAAPEGGCSVALPGDRAWRTGLLLLATFNSFVFDFVTRQKIAGTHLRFFTVSQLPVLPPGRFSEMLCFGVATVGDWIGDRAEGLVLTAWDVIEASGHTSEPAPGWNITRRGKWRAELDALFFHLYGVARPDVDYIMETFPIVKRKDERDYGEFRTKRLILEVYDAMQQAIDADAPYRSPWDSESRG